MTELSKRPVAFRIRRADADSAGTTLSETDWRYFSNEDDAWKASDALGTEYQGLYVRNGSGFRMPNEDRYKLAYDTFRGGLKDPAAVPHWDDAPSWVRDVVIVAYLQGTLDAPKRKFYGAECPSYPNCSGGCGLGCTHEIEARRAVMVPNGERA